MNYDEAKEKTKFEARARNNDNVVNRAAVEAVTKIMTSDEIQGAKRKRADAEARAKA